MLNDVIQLLQRYAAYREEGGEGLGGFAQYLLGRGRIEPAGEEHLDRLRKDIETFTKSNAGMPIDIELHVLWGQLERHRQNLIKLALRELDIRTVDEYSLLSYADLQEEGTIKGFVQFTALEPTTATEITKRMVRQQLLTTEPLVRDRRIKSIHLTDRGKQVLADCKSRMQQVSELLYLDLSQHSKEALLGMLRQLFHQRNRQRESDAATFEELYKNQTIPLT